MADVLCGKLQQQGGGAPGRLATLRAILMVSRESSRCFRERLRELDEHLRAAEAVGGGSELGAAGKVDEEARNLARVRKMQSYS